MPSITPGTRPTARHGGPWGLQSTGLMPAALGRWGLEAPKHHASHRAKSSANTAGREYQYTERSGMAIKDQQRSTPIFMNCWWPSDPKRNATPKPIPNCAFVWAKHKGRVIYLEWRCFNYSPEVQDKTDDVMSKLTYMMIGARLV